MLVEYKKATGSSDPYALVVTLIGNRVLENGGTGVNEGNDMVEKWGLPL